MDLVDIALITCGSALVLASHRLRTLRTAGFLIVLGSGLLAANWMPQPIQTIVKIAIVWTYVVVVLRFQFILAGISDADFNYDRFLRAIANDLERSLAGWPRQPAGGAFVERQRANEAAEAALIRLDQEAPPNAKWNTTRTLFRDYLMAVRDATAQDQTAEARPPLHTSESPGDELTRSWEQTLTQLRH